LGFHHTFQCTCNSAYRLWRVVAVPRCRRLGLAMPSTRCCPVACRMGGGCRPLRASCEVRAQLRPSELAPQPQSHLIRGASGRPPLGFRVPPSAVPVLGGCRPLRAYGEVRAHLTTGKLGATAPLARHPRPLREPDEIEVVLLKLPYTNPTPTLATSARHTNQKINSPLVVVLHFGFRLNG
jgi:hypothetical protein